MDADVAVKKLQKFKEQKAAIEKEEAAFIEELKDDIIAGKLIKYATVVATELPDIEKELEEITKETRNATWNMNLPKKGERYSVNFSGKSSIGNIRADNITETFRAIIAAIKANRVWDDNSKVWRVPLDSEIESDNTNQIQPQ